ncbi:MAG: hypothetical protein DRH49_02925 [Candidatus Coatesbacteria bacterium]|nr:MAG: hypothetical protein DRH49_02925 [Candidatus Coatesbacteria bacterium]
MLLLYFLELLFLFLSSYLLQLWSTYPHLCFFLYITSILLCVQILLNLLSGQLICATGYTYP